MHNRNLIQQSNTKKKKAGKKIDLKMHFDFCTHLCIFFWLMSLSEENKLFWEFVALKGKLWGFVLLLYFIFFLEKWPYKEFIRK